MSGRGQNAGLEGTQLCVRLKSGESGRAKAVLAAWDAPCMTPKTLRFMATHLF